MAGNPYKKIFANHNGILRAARAVELGVPRHVLYEIVKSGELVREAPGSPQLGELINMLTSALALAC